MKRLIRRLRYRRLQRRLMLPRLMRAFADAYPEAVFVEIGSNDGDQHDHLKTFIRSRDWRGVMVEPVPYVFARLQANYGHIERVALENCAVGTEAGTASFFALRDADQAERAGLPDWYDGIGSFSRDAVAGHVSHIPDVEERIVELEVETLTFDQLCERNDVARVDLLVIDTEGHDWEILRSVDLERHRPRLILYEHFHLEPGVRAEARRTLEASGYATKEEGFDTMALRDHEPDALVRAWERLEPAVAGVSGRES